MHHQLRLTDFTLLEEETRDRSVDRSTGGAGGQGCRGNWEIEHYEQKARRPKFNWILKKRESGGAGVDLYILNFEEGNEVDLVQGNYSTTPGGWLVEEGRRVQSVSSASHRASCLLQLITL